MKLCYVIKAYPIQGIVSNYSMCSMTEFYVFIRVNVCTGRKGKKGQYASQEG